MKNIFIPALFFLLMMCSSCIEEIDLNIDTDQSFVVIDGLIGDELQEYVVRVNTSAIIGVGNDNILNPISGANVYVVSDSGEKMEFIEDPEELGAYKAVTQAKVGSSYSVEVNLPDGSKIISTPTEVLQKVPLQEVDFFVTADGEINSSGNFVTLEYVNVFLNTTFDDNDRPFLRWRAEGIYEFQEVYPMAFNPRKCYINDNIDINNIQIFDGTLLNGVELFDQPVFRTRMNRRFNVIYCAHVTQYRISEQEFDYWANVDQLTNIDGTLFDPPPATIRGNLTNTTDPSVNVQGYFSVVSLSSKRIFIDVQREGFFAETDCTSFTFRPNPPECADCTTIQRSTLEKPDYWPF